MFKDELFDNVHLSGVREFLQISIENENFLFATTKIDHIRESAESINSLENYSRTIDISIKEAKLFTFSLRISMVFSHNSYCTFLSTLCYPQSRYM